MTLYLLKMFKIFIVIRFKKVFIIYKIYIYIQLYILDNPLIVIL